MEAARFQIDYKSMNGIKTMEAVKFPDGDLSDNFTFSVIHPDGVFEFHFRWMNDRWNLWVTLPSGEKRTAGVEPNVPSWAGFLDYGLIFITETTEITRNGLQLTTPYILTWE